jgi:pyruvate kinase
VQLARAVEAAVIVTPTATGRTPQLIARHRPRQPIIALGEDPRVLRRLVLTWGVFPAATTGTLDLEPLIDRSRELLAAEGLPPGSRMVITMGYPPGKAHTNLVLVAEA